MIKNKGLQKGLVIGAAEEPEPDNEATEVYDGEKEQLDELNDFQQ